MKKILRIVLGIIMLPLILVLALSLGAVFGLLYGIIFMCEAAYSAFVGIAGLDTEEVINGSEESCPYYVCNGEEVNDSEII